MSHEEGLRVALEIGREAALNSPEADAIFVPGGAAMTLHVIPLIEEEFGMQLDFEEFEGATSFQSLLELTRRKAVH